MANKYNARRCGKFDSLLERDYDACLALLQAAGTIESYQHHPALVAMCGGMVTWQLDFYVVQTVGQGFYIEAKGKKTPDYKVKIDVWRHERPGPLFVVERAAGTRTGDLQFTVIDQVATEGLDLERIMNGPGPAAGWPANGITQTE